MFFLINFFYSKKIFLLNKILNLKLILINGNVTFSINNDNPV